MGISVTYLVGELEPAMPRGGGSNTGWLEGKRNYGVGTPEIVGYDHRFAEAAVWLTHRGFLSSACLNSRHPRSSQVVGKPRY